MQSIETCIVQFWSARGCSILARFDHCTVAQTLQKLFLGVNMNRPQESSGGKAQETTLTPGGSEMQDQLASEELGRPHTAQLPCVNLTHASGCREA
jgi:hypothetical protein